MVKRFATLCLIVILATFLAAPYTEVAAQTAKIKIEAMSPYRLSKMGLSTRASTSGLHVVGKGTYVYLSADTTGQAITSFAWSFVQKPTGSNAAIDNPSAQFVQFLADSAGQYIVQLTINGSSTAYDTMYASRYVGVGGFQGVAAQFPQCGLCHSGKVTKWVQTGHSRIFEEGIDGKLEGGFYLPSCMKCHTTGYDASPAANNGGFDDVAAQVGWKFPTIVPNSNKFHDSLVVPYPQLAQLATIGCESCHGPGADHAGNIAKIGVSYDVGVCAQCHDAPTHHMVVRQWELAIPHATMPSGSHATSTSCFPCHSGKAFTKWLDNKSNPGYTTSDAGYPLTCTVCHDPHDATNPHQLRTVQADSLMNGYVIGDVGGNGRLCMNCHRSRYKANVKVTQWGNYFGPHENPQADMFLGQNAYEYGLPIAGLTTHTQLEDGCVTCHMSAATGKATNMLGGHTWKMAGPDSTGTEVDNVTVCQQCHGPIASFDDVKAAADYDGNGKIEGVQTEVQGLLNRLKAVLPIDPATGEPVNMAKDSNLVKGKPELMRAIYDYYFVKNDKSMGVHNAKYTFAILRAALGSLTGVQPNDQMIPKDFALSQNYPNPFNPTTEIKFSIPRAAHVQLSVYNILGELVATLADGELVPGNYRVSWNGTTQNGTPASSGIYFYRLVASVNGSNEFAITKKMMLLK